MKSKYVVFLFALMLLAMSACSGGGGDGGGHDSAPPGATYSVTYNGNGNTGGSAPVDSGDYENAQTVTVLGNTGALVKDGFVFGGWNTQANGSGTAYTGGQTFAMGTADVTLYAVWAAEAPTTGKWDESDWDDSLWGP